MGVVTSEKESKLHKAEEQSKVVRQRYPYESFDDVLPGIQNSHCPSRDNTNGRQDLHPSAQGINYQAPPAFAFSSSIPLTNPFQNNGLTNSFQSNGLANPFQKNGLKNPFQNNGLANGDIQKRGRGELFQPEFGRDVKRVKREQFDD
ncbi:hypothetical protein BOTCAL_0056g00230 [Botryotinia calthae]|uniref:Uncharacterized protein n=1 Tax=Botryotinia calthae TaxID=38488 RepID=A0A4Y8DAS8_9HELO|nr:hypothetical protein BOTCAL_0056g00230 [Botryotinia calthae]